MKKEKWLKYRLYISVIMVLLAMAIMTTVMPIYYFQKNPHYWLVTVVALIYFIPASIYTMFIIPYYIDKGETWKI